MLNMMQKSVTGNAMAKIISEFMLYLDCQGCDSQIVAINRTL
ncbi:hypothetical protein imdm_231 [gamma proteobacterium IMCC2047]|nr:hypothetical protein imdm_231 [gamma proteobacterium IMCC2047]